MAIRTSTPSGQRRHPWALLTLAVAVSLLIATPYAAAQATPTATPTPTRTVTPTPEVIRIELQPNSATRVVGGFVNYTATGHRSDGSTVLLTQRLVYTSSDPTVADAPNADPNRGHVDAVGEGTATISATEPDSGLSTTSTGDDASLRVDPLPTATASPTPTVTSTAPTTTPTPTPSRTVTPTPVLQNITLAPDHATRQVNDVQNYTATGHYSDGSTKNLTQQVTYSSSDPSVAVATNLDGNRGRVEIVGPGMATISAVEPGTGASSDPGGNGEITVPPPPTVTATATPTVTSTGPTPTLTPTPTRTTTPTPVLVNITLAPATATRQVNQTQNFTATGHYSDGSTKNLTQQVTYTSSDPSVAVATNQDSNRGLVEIVGPGMATISAVEPGTGASSDPDGNAVITVPIPPTPTTSPTPTVTSTAPTTTPTPTPSRTATPTPVLQNITLAPDHATRQVNDVQNYTATGHYSDGSTKNLTQQVTYSSSDPSVAVATNLEGNRGRVEIVGPGMATISAVEPGTGASSDPGGNGEITVPPPPTVTATATPTVTGTGPTPTLTPTPTRTVTPTPVLVNITLAPAAATRQVNDVQNFTATGHYSDGSTKNLTQKVTYTSSDPSVAVATNLEGNRGRVEIVGPGMATISAVEPGTGASSDPDGNAVITVPIPPTPTTSPTPTITGTGPTPTTTPTPTRTATPTPVLQNITLAPSEVTRQVNQTQNFTATGHYSDGSTKNLTQKVTYTSSDPSVAVAANLEGNRGRVEIVGPGIATISAVEPGTGASSDPDGNAKITVPAPPTPKPTGTPTATSTGPTATPTLSPTQTPTPTPQLESLTLSPTNPKRKVGETQNFTATGHFSDGSTKNFTQLVTYSSSDTSVAVATNQEGNRGLVQVIGPGTTTISALHVGTGVETDADGVAVLTATGNPIPTTGGGSATPRTTPTPLALGLSGPAARSADKCQRAITRAGAAFTNRKLKALDHCAARMLTCIETKPTDPSCRGKAASGCSRDLAKIGGEETRLAAAIIKRCGAVGMANLGDDGGLGYASLATDCAALDTALTNDVSTLAACVVRQHECQVEDLFSAALPRAGELFRLAGADLGVGSCLPDLGGVGDDVGNTDTGKHVAVCAKAITRAAARVAAKRLKSLERCVGAIFTCVQVKPLDPRCVLQRAQRTCDHELARMATAVAGLGPALTGRCGSVDFDTLRDQAGIDLDDLAGACEDVQVPAVATLADYETCLARRHVCDVEELLRFEVPRAAELLDLVGQTLHSAFCPVP